MDPAHRALLQKHRVALATELLVSDHIVPYLYQEQILTDSQVEDIESQSTNKRKVFRLLDLLPNRGPLAFSCFLRSLDDFSWVRERLLQELETEPGPPGPALTGKTKTPEVAPIRTRCVGNRVLSGCCCCCCLYSPKKRLS